MNAFLQIAETQMAAPVKRAAARREAKTVYVATGVDARMQESAKGLKNLRAWQKECREALEKTPAAGLLKFLDTMTLSSAPALIRLVEEAHWLKDMTQDERALVLGQISRAISKVRRKAELLELDDPLPGQPDNAFLTIRAIFWNLPKAPKGRRDFALGGHEVTNALLGGVAP